MPVLILSHLPGQRGLSGVANEQLAVLSRSLANPESVVIWRGGVLELERPSKKEKDQPMTLVIPSGAAIVAGYHVVDAGFPSYPVAADGQTLDLLKLRGPARPHV
jgi:hypothetical protein